MFKNGLLIAAVALVADQISKYIVLYVLKMPEVQAMEVTPFFNLVMVWNHGVSFGLLNGSGHQYQPLFLSLLALAVVALLVGWLRKSETKWNATGIGLVVGGALGNVIDRALYGAVADFLDFHVAGFHWPAFNVADSCICIGVFMLVTEGFFCKNKKQSV